jgi:hypothetical protein
VTAPLYGNPYVAPIAIYRGDQFALAFRVRDDVEDITQANYQQFPGFTARGQVRAEPESDDVLLEFTCTIEEDPDGVAGPDGVIADRIRFEATGSQTRAIPLTAPRICNYDIEIGTAPDFDDAITYLRGEVHIDHDVTRA